MEAQAAVLPNERFAHVVQRYYRLFRWCDRLPNDAEDRLPLRSDFQRLMFMSPDEYLAAASQRIRCREYRASFSDVHRFLIWDLNDDRV